MTAPAQADATSDGPSEEHQDSAAYEPIPLAAALLAQFGADSASPASAESAAEPMLPKDGDTEKVSKGKPKTRRKSKRRQKKTKPPTAPNDISSPSTAPPRVHPPVTVEEVPDLGSDSDGSIHM